MNINFFNGIKNFLQIISDNWLNILICIGLIVGIVKKTKVFLNKSKEERFKIIKQQISETILKRITKAEIDFAEWEKSGAIKRSQVIEEIYNQYPILNKIADQDDFVAWVDEEINNALKTLRDVVKENQKDNKGETEKTE